jgi:hypothetical protein
MDVAVKGLIGLAVVAFVLATLGSLTGVPIVGTWPEAFSRASNNLCLLAIALLLAFKPGSASS